MKTNRRVQMQVCSSLPAKYCVSSGVLALCLAAVNVFGQVDPMRSKWDAGLLGVELGEVHVKADSLVSAWQTIQEQYLVRTVLLQAADHPGHSKFVFDAGKCTVSGLLQSLVTAYPDYVYTQDPRTGVAWLHPKEIAYSDLMPWQVRVSRDALGVPMLQNIVYPLCRLFRFNLGTGPWDTLGIRGTYNYPVDLPAGTWTVRDILNFCCVANPATTFGVTHFGDFDHITLRSFGSHYAKHMTPCALYFWQSEIDGSTQGAPPKNDLIERLASTDPRIRMAARKFLELANSLYPDSLVTDAPADERGLWTAIANLSILVRTEGTGHTRSLLKIRQVLSGETNSSVRPALRTLASAELARVAGNALVLAQATNQPLIDSENQRVNADMMKLERATSVPLSATEIADVKHDMIRVLRYSKLVRDKLLEKKPQWAGFAKDDIEALGNTDIFSLP